MSDSTKYVGRPSAQGGDIAEACPLNLYREYSRDEALAAFGEADKRNYCDGQWVVLPDAVLCFSEIGASSPGSHFMSSGRFCWSADKAYRIKKADPAFLPPEASGGSQRSELPIHLLGRAKAQGSYVYLGQLEPTYAYQPSGGRGHGCSDHSLSPGVPVAIWSRFDPAMTGPDGELVSRLDESLQRVEQMTIEERIDLYEPLLSYWFGAADPVGLPADLHGLPKALYRFMELASGDSMRMGCQNIFEKPHKLQPDEDGWVTFYVENQGVYLWGYRPGDKDPMVFGQYKGEEPWIEEGLPLSVFLIQAILFEGIVSAPFGAFSAWLSEDELRQIESNLPTIPFGDWRWPTEHTRFLGGAGAFATVAPNGPDASVDGFGVYLGARSEAPLRFLTELNTIDWDHKAF